MLIYLSFEERRDYESQCKYSENVLLTDVIIIIIIIISIFKEDNVFSIIASLPYGPPVNTDINYYLTFLCL